MADIQQICQKKVEAGIQEMQRTGKDVCIINEVWSRHPAGIPHAELPYFGQSAEKHGLHAIPVRVVLTDRPSEETADYVLLSRKPVLSAEEIGEIIPDYLG